MYEISKNCDGCGNCMSSCPLDIIRPAGDVYKIGIGCNDCGVCAGVCELGAITRTNGG